MWRLLHKGREYHSRLRNTPFKRVVYLCALVHLFFIFVACFVHTDEHLHLMVHAGDARVVCLPSFMVQPQRARIRTHKKQHKPQRKHKKEQKKHKKTTARPQPKTAVKQEKPKRTKQKKALKKVIPEQVAEEIISEQPEEAAEVAPAHEAPQEIAHQDDTIYVNRETYQMLETAQALQAAVSLHWAPPAGMPTQTSCLIRVALDAQGRPITIDVVEKSGIAVFDMAARSALRATEYPPSVWGKTMVIHFNEEFA
jgi:hypothetical protein